MYWLGQVAVAWLSCSSFAGRELAPFSGLEALRDPRHWPWSGVALRGPGSLLVDALGEMVRSLHPAWPVGLEL